MVDIADKLFPNLLTLLTQLAATGIIYLLYRKYVHVHAMNFLDKQVEDLNRAQLFAEEIEEKAEQKESKLAAEYEVKAEQLRKSQERMRQEAERERQEILKRAEAEKELLLSEAQVEINKDREKLLREVEEHVLDLAVLVAERTLERYSYDEGELFQALETELEQMNYEAN